MMMVFGKLLEMNSVPVNGYELKGSSPEKESVKIIMVYFGPYEQFWPSVLTVQPGYFQKLMADPQNPKSLQWSN